MRKVLMGVVWFLILWFGTLTIGGAIAGSFRAAKIDLEGKTVSDIKKETNSAGLQAGTEFGVRYGGLVFLGSILIAIIGTATGVLPGTKRKKVNA